MNISGPDSEGYIQHVLPHVQILCQILRFAYFGASIETRKQKSVFGQEVEKDLGNSRTQVVKGEKEMVGRKVKWGALGGLNIGPGEGSENNVKDV